MSNQNMNGPPLSLLRLVIPLALVNAVIFAVVFGLRLREKPETGTVDCDRARGTCLMTAGDRHQSINIADLVSTEVQTFNARGAHYYIGVKTRNGPEFFASGRGLWGRTRDGFAAVVSGWNDFIRDPSKPTFKISYVASDVDLYFPGFMVVISVVIALFFWFIVARLRKLAGA